MTLKVSETSDVRAGISLTLKILIDFLKNFCYNIYMNIEKRIAIEIKNYIS